MSSSLGATGLHGAPTQLDITLTYRITIDDRAEVCRSSWNSAWRHRIAFAAYLHLLTAEDATLQRQRLFRFLCLTINCVTFISCC